MKNGNKEKLIGKLMEVYNLAIINEDYKLAFQMMEKISNEYGVLDPNFKKIK